MILLRMWQAAVVLYLAAFGSKSVYADEDISSKDGRVLSVFNVVTFPNSACGASNGYNGTCFTSSECTAKGGTASGTCASSFGVCCVFSIACGGSSSANNSYAIMSSYSTSSDADPCTYTFCKTTSDVCKLRIDFDTMVLTGPNTMSSTAVYTDSTSVGDCGTDTLTISNPGGPKPPTICGYNTGQHMFVPASDGCNQINIDIDTGSTSTTRKWQIKVTQYECGNMKAPEQDCLQYHTAATGTIASFNFDTTASGTVAATQYHLSNQYYDICIRRTRGYCSLCFSPEITSTTTTNAASFGISAGSVAAIQTAASGSHCTGVTTINAIAASNVGYGDYLEIIRLQDGTGTSTAAGATATISRICGAFWDATVASDQVTHATACTYATPFKVGVHFDNDDIILAPGDIAAAQNAGENPPVAANNGIGYSGFYLAYWQNTC